MRFVFKQNIRHIRYVWNTCLTKKVLESADNVFTDKIEGYRTWALRFLEITAKHQDDGISNHKNFIPKYLDNAQAACVTTHKGSWVKLLMCLILIVTIRDCFKPKCDLACSRLQDSRARWIEKARRRKFPLFRPANFSRAFYFPVFPTICEPGTG